MDLKVLLQAYNRVWLIEEQAAYYYAEVLNSLIHSNNISNGLFSDSPSPYRANAANQKTSNGEVLVIPIEGVMMKNDYCGSMGTATMANLINAASKESSIKSIVLSMNTPGGSVDGTEDLSNAVSNTKKTVVVHANMMASAGYWAGSGADEIIINGHTSMVGSIGTMAMMSDDREKQQRNGVKQVVVFASRSVDKNRAALEALDGKPENFITQFLDPLNAAFEKTVTKNRSGKVEMEKEDVGTGKLYIGNQAIKAGLADKMGSLDYAIKRSLQLAKTIS